MLSDICKEKKITFVMGAGASLPFITHGDICLSTKYLTEQISNHSRWDVIYNEFMQHYPANRNPELNFNVTVDDILPIIEKLKTINEREVSPEICKMLGISTPQKIDDYYGIGEINFEHILYLLDKVCNCLFDRKSSLDNILFDIWGEDNIQRQELESKKGWNYVPFLCREVLVNAIIELWESCDKEKAIEENKQFFASILEKFKSISIYSLNYDPLLYEAIKQIKVKGSKRLGETELNVDKIIATGFSNGKNFNSKEFFLSDNVVAFLHGHIGFVPRGGKDGLFLNQIYPNAQKIRISDVANGRERYHREGLKGIHYNVSITSGLEKFESFYNNPYSCYILRFSEDVIKSEYLVFIGSGLGDYHINLFATTAWRLVNGYDEEPRNFLCLRKPGIGRKKIVIVTSGWEKLLTIDEDCLSFLCQRSIDRSLRLFKLLNEGISVEDRKKVESFLRNNGYANINRGLFLYLKGTEQFYPNISNIKDLF